MAGGFGVSWTLSFCFFSPSELPCLVLQAVMKRMLVASINVVSVFIFFCLSFTKFPWCKGLSNRDALLITPEAKDIKFQEVGVFMMHEYKL
jgi:hypothetical protein